jgi:hypothetical protein
MTCSAAAGNPPFLFLLLPVFVFGCAAVLRVDTIVVNKASSDVQRTSLLCVAFLLHCLAT